MGYFTSQRNGWYELNDFNLSGTGAGGLSYDLPTVGTWTTVARFDNDEIDLKSIIYRSDIQDNGSLSNMVTSTGGTALLSMRILTPGEKVGLSLFSNLGFSGTQSLYITEANFIPSRSIPRNSLVQAKIENYPLEQISGTDNKFYLQFNYTYRGVDPQLNSLLEY